MEGSVGHTHVNLQDKLQTIGIGYCSKECFINVVMANQKSLEFEHADGMVLNHLKVRFFPASMCILSILGTAGARTDS